MQIRQGHWKKIGHKRQTSTQKKQKFIPHQTPNVKSHSIIFKNRKQHHQLNQWNKKQTEIDQEILKIIKMEQKQLNISPQQKPEQTYIKSSSKAKHICQQCSKRLKFINKKLIKNNQRLNTIKLEMEKFKNYLSHQINYLKLQFISYIEQVKQKCFQSINNLPKEIFKPNYISFQSNIQASHNQTPKTNQMKKSLIIQKSKLPMNQQEQIPSNLKFNRFFQTLGQLVKNTKTPQVKLPTNNSKFINKSFQKP